MMVIELISVLVNGLKMGYFDPDCKPHTRLYRPTVTQSTNMEMEYIEIDRIWIEPKNGKLCIE